MSLKLAQSPKRRLPMQLLMTTFSNEWSRKMCDTGLVIGLENRWGERANPICGTSASFEPVSSAMSIDAVEHTTQVPASSC
jgi:hypothetical protein